MREFGKMPRAARDDGAPASRSPENSASTRSCCRDLLPKGFGPLLRLLRSSQEAWTTAAWGPVCAGA
jgi:hypothetical protein